MNKTTIHDEYQVIRYLYAETSVQETNDVETLTAIDTRIYQEVKETGILLNEIDKILYCPKIATLKKLLAYSKNLQIPASSQKF